jgi:hypothetical protein
MPSKEYTTLEVAGQEVRLSSPSKVYFPGPGWTKLDLRAAARAPQPRATSVLRTAVRCGTPHAAITGQPQRGPVAAPVEQIARRWDSAP